ncbi:MAG: hypothetical protein ACREDS_08360 [Limisphaerales bacterium]
MKFTVEIKMTVEINVEKITKAAVIRDLVQPAKPKAVVMEEIMDDRLFERAARNQRLLDQLQADEALLLRYAKMLAAFEAFSVLESASEHEKLGDQMERIEISLLNRLNEADAAWFEGAIKNEVWSESTAHFSNAFRVTVSKPEVRSEYIGGRDNG